MKRSLILEDAGDRAQKHLKIGLSRIPLKFIGFWPDNRGGMGALGHHVHEIAHDCMSNKTNLDRYHHVQIIEVPDAFLQQVREANKVKCKNDPLMPNYSPDMKYICLGKTHFVHAQKLAADGGRTLYNQNHTPITWQESDKEGAEIMHLGPLCRIYDGQLLHDEEAVRALASDDNLNAVVQMVEDEMQAYGRASDMFDKIVANDEHGRANTSQILATLETIGLGQFRSDEWKSFVALRVSLSQCHSQVLQQCQFAKVSGRVRVNADDFGLSAKLDVRAPWTKVSVMLHQYLQHTLADKPVDTRAGCRTFAGRKVTTTRKLQPDVMNELATLSHFVIRVDDFIVELLTCYGEPSENGQTVSHDLLCARGAMLAKCGHFTITVGERFDKHTKAAQAKHQSVTPHERLVLLDEDGCLKHFSNIEHLFRDELVKKNVFTQDSIPTAIRPPVPDGILMALTGDCGGVGVKKEPVDANSVLAEGQTLTEAHVFRRLGVKGCGEEVYAPWTDPAELNSGVKRELHEEGAVETLAGSQPRDSDWKIVKLMSISLPNAEVELVTKEKQPDVDGQPQADLDVRVSRTMAADELMPFVKARIVERILHPSLRLPGKTLDPYGFDNESVRTTLEMAAATHAILWNHMAAINSVEGVTVSNIGDPNKLPIILQVRAKEDFKKGALLLVPAHGKLARKDTEECQGWHRNAEIAVHTQIPIHASMMSCVELNVITGQTDGRHRAAGPVVQKSEWLIGSPLLDGKTKLGREQCFENLAPFWALLQPNCHTADHNMEIEITSWKDAGFEALSGGRNPKVSKSAALGVEIPIARNIRAISKGDVLVIPFQ